MSKSFVPNSAPLHSVAKHAPAHVHAIAPYQAGKPVAAVVRDLGLDINKIIKLASNENPLGMGLKAKAALLQAATDLARYPDANGFELKAALAHKHGIDASQIILGNGSNDVLEIATQAFLTPETSAVYSQYAFAVYALATQARGAKGLVAPAQNHGHCLNAIASSIQSNTRMVFIANPNNPTGTFIAPAEIKAFLRDVPKHVLVVLDEAYNEYLRPEHQYNSIEWVAEHGHLMVSRSFSKAYGLAGLRVGYGVAHPDVIDLMNRVRQPFNVSTLGLACAQAALFDDEFLEQTYTLNQQGLQQLQTGLDALNIPYIPSFGNFVLARVGTGRAVFSALERQGIITRPVCAYGLPEWLRISVGLPHENQAFLNALPKALAMVAAEMAAEVAVEVNEHDKR